MSVYGRSGMGGVCAPQLYSTTSSHRRYPAHTLDIILKTLDDADTVSPLEYHLLVVVSDSDDTVFKMPHSFGYRARTRDMFKRGFKSALSSGVSRELGS